MGAYTGNTIPAELLVPLSLGVAKALRQSAGLLGVVNKDMQNIPASYDETVNVSYAPSIVAEEVVPSITPTLPGGKTFKKKQVKLAYWQKGEFQLDSREEAKLVDAQGSWIPQCIQEAVEAVLVPARAALYDACLEFNGYSSTTEETFINKTEALETLGDGAVKLSNQLCPEAGRIAMLSSNERRACYGVSLFMEACKSGDQTNRAFRQGVIGNVLDFETHFENGVANLPSLHTSGNASAWTLDGEHAIGATALDVTGGTGDFEAGDIVQIGNFSYSVTGALANGVLTINEPGLRETCDDSAVTLKASHTIAGYGFHPSGLLLVGRVPMQKGAAGQHQIVTDPVTGLMMKLSILGGDEIVIYRVSMLFGAGCIDPRKGVRFALEAQSSS